MYKRTATTPAQAVSARATTLAHAHGGSVVSVWATGFSTKMSEADALQMAAEPEVDYVQQDFAIAPPQRSIVRPEAAATPSAVQTPVSWGLDRIDQHALPLDNHYAYDDSAGEGASVYILSTGIQRDHPDFGGRASYGPNFSGDGLPDSHDCVGTGTEIAGVIGGTQFGVAKKASLIGVRIFDCVNPVINAPFSGIVAAFAWVVANAHRPAAIVYNVEDGCVDLQTAQRVPCGAQDLQAELDAQNAAHAGRIPVVHNGGGSGADRCDLDGGAAPGTFYVGATTQTDTRASFSNFGGCLNMWAPGAAVTTDGLSGSIVVSGTHVASGYVAGTVALFLAKPEFAGATPDRIYDELINHRSTTDVLTGIGPDSPNRLLFTGPSGLFTVGDPVEMAQNSDGRLMLLGVTPQGKISQQMQTAVGSSSWSAPLLSSTTGWQSVGAQPNADARVEMSGVTPAGDLWDRSQTSAGSSIWVNWTQLTAVPSGVPVARVELAHNRSNRLELFVTDRQGNTYRRAQTSANARSWGAWTSFGRKLRSITAETGGNDQIVLLGVDDAGQVWQSNQTSATDDNWSGFTQLPGFGMATISAARNSNGTLELVGVDTGGNSWHRTQTAVGATSWSPWAPLSIQTLHNISAQADNGQVHLVAVDNLGQVWQTKQTAANASTYSAWTRISGITIRS